MMNTNNVGTLVIKKQKSGILGAVMVGKSFVMKIFDETQSSVSLSLVCICSGVRTLITKKKV